MVKLFKLIKMEFKSNTSIIVLGCILISIMLCLSNALINISISTNKDILDDVFEKEAYLIVNACNKIFINEIDSYKFEFETVLGDEDEGKEKNSKKSFYIFIIT